MRCGACAVGIELALGKKKGVKSAMVSLNERMAAVEHDSAIVTPSDIAKTCERSRIYYNSEKVKQTWFFKVIGVSPNFFYPIF